MSLNCDFPHYSRSCGEITDASVSYASALITINPPPDQKITIMTKKANKSDKQTKTDQNPAKKDNKTDAKKAPKKGENAAKK